MWESDRLLPYACMFQLQSGHDRRRNSTLPQTGYLTYGTETQHGWGTLAPGWGGVRALRAVCGLRVPASGIA